MLVHVLLREILQFGHRYPGIAILLHKSEIGFVDIRKIEVDHQAFTDRRKALLCQIGFERRVLLEGIGAMPALALKDAIEGYRPRIPFDGEGSLFIRRQSTRFAKRE